MEDHDRGVNQLLLARCTLERSIGLRNMCVDEIATLIQNAGHRLADGLESHVAGKTAVNPLAKGIQLLQARSALNQSIELRTLRRNMLSNSDGGCRPRNVKWCGRPDSNRHGLTPQAF